TDVRAELDLDGVRLSIGPVDADAAAEPGPALELSVRAGESRVERTHIHRGGPHVDEDVLCELDARVRLELGGILVRSLSLRGVADVDGAPGTRASCAEVADHPDRVEIHLDDTQVELEHGEPSLVLGHVTARAPIGIASRFTPLPFRGTAEVDAAVRWDPSLRLPEVRSTLRASGVEMAEFSFTESLEGDLSIEGGVIRSRRLATTYGHATVVIEDFSLAPLADDLPLSTRRVSIDGLHWEDLMEKIDVTRNTIVAWGLDDVVVAGFSGTLNPLRLDGDIDADTSGFAVFDRSYRAADRKRMVGVPAAHVTTRFGVRPHAVQFMGSRATFGGSDVMASVVVGFDNTISLEVPKGSRIDLSDIGPLVDIPIDGVADLSVRMNGRASSAPLTGELAISGLEFAGFPLGDVESSRVRFVPLVVTLLDVQAKKGASRYSLPTAKIAFDAGSTVLADARVVADRMDVRDFFAMWHFDEDPRWDEVAGVGRMDARVHYDLGGKADACGRGVLRVDGAVDLSRLALFGEQYDGAGGPFDFRWVDPDAGYLGMELDAPSLLLRKGKGSVLGALHLSDGARVSGELVGGGVPLSRIDTLGALAPGLEGTASGVARVSGTLDALEAEVDAHISPVRVGRATLPASDFTVKLVPIARPPRAIGRTPCGRPHTAGFDRSEYDADAPAGTFHVDGHLLGRQLGLEGVKVTRQRMKALAGRIRFDALDVGALAELHPLLALAEPRLSGNLSGSLDVKNLETARPGLGELGLRMDALSLRRGTLRVGLATPAEVRLEGG
ncbi:MAG: hypothetical protein FJ104_11405, partial [Deltaproteobacteria bacterium]|nr:hypothetical protein [Deltaproteobacteria bacterium]